MTNKQSLARIRFLGGIFLLIMVALIWRLYMVQVVEGEEYRHLASGQYVKNVNSDYDRGSIFINDGKHTFPVATIATGYTLAINPRSISPNEDIAKSIYEALSGDDQRRFNKDEFIEDFVKKAGKDDPYEELLTRLDKDSYKQIDELNLSGVAMYSSRWRSYPNNDLLAHVVGFTSFHGDEIKGTYGLERQYDNTLQRKDKAVFTNFFAEAFSTAKDAINQQLASNLYLTIDRTAQVELEKQLDLIIVNWDSRSAAGIVMDPKTGAILAMASSPDFDLNNFSQVSDSAVYTNPLVENVYEMGSIMKPLTMAYALDTGSVSSDTYYNDTGSLVIDQARISNYDLRARGTVPVQEILNQSLNVGTAFLLNQMGRDAFKDYFIKSGLNEVTGIDLPHETSPLTDSLLSSPRKIEYVTASYGQGFAVSPIAMTRALALLANEGRLPNPYVVSRLQHELGTWSDNDPDLNTEQVIKRETAREVTEMLVEVVDTALRGGYESLDNYSIAAKTGTAQIANTTGNYRDDAYLHTFFGYFPAYEPKYLILLMNEEPVGARYSSETLTDPFMNLTKFLINHNNVAPDR